MLRELIENWPLMISGFDSSFFDATRKIYRKIKSPSDRQFCKLLAFKFLSTLNNRKLKMKTSEFFFFVHHEHTLCQTDFRQTVVQKQYERASQKNTEFTFKVLKGQLICTSIDLETQDVLFLSMQMSRILFLIFQLFSCCTFS